MGTGSLRGCAVMPRVALRDFLVTCTGAISIPELFYDVSNSTGLFGSQRVGIRLSVAGAALSAAGKMADAVLVDV